ncbi:MAG: Fic family protein [Myxococcota bacterium]
MTARFPIYGCPRETLLAELATENADFLRALLRIGAQHSGVAASGFRDRWIENTRRAAHPDDIESLVWVLLRRAVALSADCKAPRDDLLVAAFIMDGLATIQPFERGNARTAMDLAVYFLMRRWGLEGPPVRFDSQAEQVLAALAPQGGLSDTGLERYFAVSETASELAGAELDTLKQDPGYMLIVDWLEQAMGLSKGVQACG